MLNLVELAAIPPFAVWGEAVRARQVQGTNVAFAVVELAPDVLVPEHRHVQEQLGMVITGSVTFRIGDVSREMGPGGTWRVASSEPHEVQAGPAGAVVIDVFSPIREDWDRFDRLDPIPPRWPG